MVPVLSYIVENILKHCVLPQKQLVLKCDGMLKNKNMPQKICDVLLKKYSGGIITSENHHQFEYILTDWVKCIVVK